MCVRRRRIAVEQSRRAHDDAGQAVAALTRLLLDKGLLQRMKRCTTPKPFDCRDSSRFRGRRRSVARLNGSSIQQNRAASAHALSATEPSTLQLEVISQDVNERGICVRYDRPSCAVDVERDGLRQGLKLPNSPACNASGTLPALAGLGTTLTILRMQQRRLRSGGKPSCRKAPRGALKDVSFGRQY